MNRALLTAPVARDLTAETNTPGSPLAGLSIARILGATNGTLQAWDTLHQDEVTAAADPQITVYPTLQSIPNALRKYLVQFGVYPSVLASGQPSMKRWIDCTVLDFIKTNNGVKAVTTLVGGDRPQEWDLLHRWSGNVAETLGAP